MKLPFFLKAGLLLGLCAVYAQAASAAIGKQPITVNGDRVEFVAQGKEVQAEGHVEIFYQENVLTCDHVRVFIDEKLAVAEGHVKLTKPGKEELRGDMIVYDFGDQTATIINPSVRMHPYYGTSKSMERNSENDFVLSNGEISTCDLPHPHYRLTCKTVHVNQERLLTAKGVKFLLWDIPLFYMPVYSQRLTDKRPRFMITPGYKKNFGAELFGAYRYYLTENAKGRLHFDWYQNKGFAQGIDLNYDTKSFGQGNAKYYRIDEKDTRVNVPEAQRERNERSKIELRHKWDLSERDHMVLEYYRQSDTNFRKDYFYREYEKDTNPKSFLLLSHVYPNATLSLLGQPRVNTFDSVVEKIPELKLETVNQKIAQTPFYFKNTTSLAQLDNAAADSDRTAAVSRGDTSNQLSYVFRFMDLDFNPFVGHRDTFYSRGLNDEDHLMRGMFFGGVDVSTKLFKIYDLESKVMRLDVHQLRHIVTPSVQYRYQHEPTVEKSKIGQLDDVDSLEELNKITLGVENRFQTKRDNVPVDLATLLLTSDYYMERNSTYAQGFDNIKYDLEFKPYAWWEFDSDAEFDTARRDFRNLNADFWVNVGKARSTLGYRFKKNESSQLTAGFTSPLNPFWKLGIYERFEFKTGDLIEQEYTLERDLHCWTMQFIVTQREDSGISFLVAFNLKAFPEFGINAEKTFAPPRSE